MPVEFLIKKKLKIEHERRLPIHVLSIHVMRLKGKEMESLGPVKVCGRVKKKLNCLPLSIKFQFFFVYKSTGSCKN